MNNHKTYPYVTVLEHDGITYYGIIKIKSKQYSTMYCFQMMDESQQEELLSLAKYWWEQSNRSIPVCIFLREEMEIFEGYTKRFNTDTINFVSGPVISLSNIPTKRIKRRNVALKKKK